MILYYITVTWIVNTYKKVYTFFIFHISHYSLLPEVNRGSYPWKVFSAPVQNKGEKRPEQAFIQGRIKPVPADHQITR